MSSAENAGDADTLRLDLRGVKCPLNWAHAKVRLESMRRGETLELTIDVRAANGVWLLRIEK